MFIAVSSATIFASTVLRLEKPSSIAFERVSLRSEVDP